MKYENEHVTIWKDHILSSKFYFKLNSHAFKEWWNENINVPDDVKQSENGFPIEEHNAWPIIHAMRKNQYIEDPDAVSAEVGNDSS